MRSLANILSALIRTYQISSRLTKDLSPQPRSLRSMKILFDLRLSAQSAAKSTLNQR